MTIFLHVNLPPAEDCLPILFKNSLILIKLQRNLLSEQRCTCFDFYKSRCDINKCLADDLTCTNLPGNNECHPPNVPKELTFLLWHFHLHLIFVIFQG
jgi:hypothetical protein